eukprot:MONOS_14030.1-p1 / transcript=MONOS_14030.1 / gene=MONOS_14030 / organism=Monocercomonoides_exilis_PA203 / gene_product=unspecified product / transcript_product=unspecified product / location=Mono_scaffold00924:20288-21226(+) / protein_length=294 / sequence_SO=supercontig / SO=protein_coding / is_pseudo=false
MNVACDISKEVLMICVPLLLKDALNKEESEKAQKDVEMALIALTNIAKINEEKDCLFLNEITEIIKHHLVHRNLTHFSYQLAWDLFVRNADLDWETESGKFFGAFFAREVVGELEELKSCVCWEKKKKRKRKGEKAKGRKGRKEKLIFKRWHSTIRMCYNCSGLCGEGWDELVRCLVGLSMTAEGSSRGTCRRCFDLFEGILFCSTDDVGILISGGAVDYVMEKLCQRILDKEITNCCLKFNISLLNRMREKIEDENEKERQKMQNRRIIDLFEEGGYEDLSDSFQWRIQYLL